MSSTSPARAYPEPGALTRMLLDHLGATRDASRGTWRVSPEALRAVVWLIAVLEQNRRLRPRPPADIERYVRALAPRLRRWRRRGDSRGLLGSLWVVHAHLTRR